MTGLIYVQKQRSNNLFTDPKPRLLGADLGTYFSINSLQENKILAQHASELKKIAAQWEFQYEIEKFVQNCSKIGEPIQKRN